VTPTRMRPYAALALLPLALLGCRDGTAPALALGLVNVQAARTEYRPMDLVVVTTTNRSDQVVYDDHCGGELQGFEFLGRWNGSYGAARACADVETEQLTNHRVAIPPGATHVDEFHVNGQAYAGSWRVELLLSDAAGRLLPQSARVTNTFRVVVP